MMPDMRTTLNLDERALVRARSFASQEHISLGEAVSRLILEPVDKPFEPIEGFPTFPAVPYVPGHVITLEMIKELEDEW